MKVFDAKIEIAFDIIVNALEKEEINDDILNTFYKKVGGIYYYLYKRMELNRGFECQMAFNPDEKFDLNFLKKD